MNKKGISGLVIIILVIFFFLLIVGLITLLIVLNQKEVKQQITEGDSNLNIYLKARDSHSNTQIGGEYIILNRSNLITGKLSKDSYTEIKNLQNGLSYLILASSDGFYSSLLNKSFTQEEKNSNTSKIYFSLNKIGKIGVTNTGNIENGERRIILNISSKDYFNKLEICVSWTSGITSVNSDPELVCDSNWINISGKLCSCSNIEENCNKLNGNVCYPLQKEIPNRLKNTVDKCFYYGNNLKDSFVLIPFTVKSESLNSLDSLTFYLFDNNLVYSGEFKYMSEYQGVNLGTREDYSYLIKYNETF